MNASGRPSVDVGPVTIAYRQAGSGPPLVLLHGGPMDGREFAGQLSGLSDEFTVVAWDMPGCGGSSDPPEDFGPRQYADTLAGFVKALALERPNVLGVSFGSGLALEFYRWYPAIPSSLILASAYAGWAGSLSQEAVEQRRQQMRRLIELPPEAFAEAWISTLFSEDSAPKAVEDARTILRTFHRTGQRTLLSGFADHDVRDVLPTIQVPTLLLYGDRDVRSPLAIAEVMHREIPGSELVLIANSGHLVDMQAAEAFNDAVRQFLKRVAT